MRSASTLLTGCFFEHPLTSGPSKDINSWLLGVWEARTPKAELIVRQIVPITGDRYYVSFRPGRKKAFRAERGNSKAGYRVCLTAAFSP